MLTKCDTNIYLSWNKVVYYNRKKNAMLCYDMLCSAMLCYTTLHYNTLCYTTLCYTTLHYTVLHYTTLHCTTLHYTTLHCTTLHYTMLHYTTLHYTVYILFLYVFAVDYMIVCLSVEVLPYLIILTCAWNKHIITKMGRNKSLWHDKLSVFLFSRDVQWE